MPSLEEKLEKIYMRVEDLDQKVTRRLDYIDSSLSRPKVYTPSSIHDPDYIHAVVEFYGKRICCLTGCADSGNPEEQGYSKNKAKAKKTDAEKQAEMLYVNAAHLIRTCELDAYIKANSTNQKEELTSQSPRAAILLTKKFEVLLDMYLWTLIPADPKSSKPHYVVHVLFKRNAAWNVLRTSVNEFYLKFIDGWLEELQTFHEQKIEFEETKCPSFRAVSHHAEVAVSKAKDNGWINFDQAAALKSFSALSPLHSPAASNSFQNSAPSQDDNDNLKELEE